MMRVLKFLAVLVLVLVVAAGAVLAKTFIGMRPMEDGTTVTEGVNLVKDGYVSAYIVDVGQGQVALVDCGNSVENNPVVAALAARGLGPEAVQAVLLTHGHPDHAAGCVNFPKARIYAHQAEVAIVEGREGTHGPIPALMGAKDIGVRVTSAVEDGGSVTVGDVEFRAFLVPGHTVGSTAWLARKTLFFGDAANSDAAGALTEAAWPFSDDVARSTASVTTLAGRLHEGEVEHLAFGHSGPVPGPGPLNAFARSGR